MKDFERIDRLRREWSDKYVEADASVPALRRFAGRVGRVMTINMNGHALVRFSGTNDIGWYDIDLARLRIVAQPALERKPTEGPAKSKAAPRDVVEASTANVRLASAKQAAKEFADETVDSLTAELEIQAVNPSGETAMSDDSVDSLAATEAPTEKRPASTADMLAAARVAKASKPKDDPPADSAAQKVEAPTSAASKELVNDEIFTRPRQTNTPGDVSDSVQSQHLLRNSSDLSQDED